VPELNDQERVALLTSRLGLPEGGLKPELALEALRHGSYVHERSLGPGREVFRSNERLEFLGDAVLGFLIARRVYERFPDAPEGELTRLRAALVREESLAIVARNLGLGELLLLGRGEQRSGGRENAARLADALEAVLAAVLLSSGLDRTVEVLERLLAPLFEQGTLARDSKTELQQLFQSRKRTPQYHVLAVNGPDHARSYDVEVRLDGAPLGRGSGRSKKEAEQAAALAALREPLVVERALLDEPVSLATPDPRWRELALEEAARLRAALPEAEVEHVGSTAVPGLEAKPIIDLLVGVRELSGALRLPDYEACGEAGVADASTSASAGRSPSTPRWWSTAPRSGATRSPCATTCALIRRSASAMPARSGGRSPPERPRSCAIRMRRKAPCGTCWDARGAGPRRRRTAGRNRRRVCLWAGPASAILRAPMRATFLILLALALAACKDSVSAPTPAPVPPKAVTRSPTRRT